MGFALEIMDGDLVIGPGGYRTVSGPAKIRQDLSLALTEPYGIDRFHPGWGSTLSFMIGTEIRTGREEEVRSEVTRVIDNYMRLQAQALSFAAVNNAKPSLKADEIVRSVDGVDVKQTEDRLSMRIRLRNGSLTPITLVQAVTP